MPPGFESKAGFAREAITFSKVWPSSSSALVTRLLPLASENVNIQHDQQSVVTKDSRSIPSFNKVIRSSIVGPMTVNMDYEGLEQLFALAMGHEAPRISGILMPEEQTPSVSYRHVIEFDRDINQGGWVADDGFVAGPSPVGDGLIANQQKVRRGTVAILKNGSVWEARSVMVNSLTVQFSPAGVLVAVNLLGYDITYNGTVNASIGTINCVIERVRFRDAKLYVVEGGGSVLDNEVPEINGFQVQISNNLQAINTRDTKKLIEEPQRGGAVTVTGGFSLPRWSTFDLLDKNKDSVQVHMALLCTGETIPGGGGETFEFNLYFPSVTLTGASAPSSGPGQIVQNYAYMAIEGGTPIGFPETSKRNPMVAEFVNTNGDHTLLD